MCAPARDYLLSDFRSSLKVRADLLDLRAIERARRGRVFALAAVEPLVPAGSAGDAPFRIASIASMCRIASADGPCVPWALDGPPSTASWARRSPRRWRRRARHAALGEAVLRGAAGAAVARRGRGRRGGRAAGAGCRGCRRRSCPACGLPVWPTLPAPMTPLTPSARAARRLLELAQVRTELLELGANRRIEARGARRADRTGRAGRGRRGGCRALRRQPARSGLPEACRRTRAIRCSW